MDAWLELYRRVARANGGEPDAGRRLLCWARQAGFTDITPSAAAWCFATPENRVWWSGLWADRTVGSVYAKLAVDGGHATTAQLNDIAAAWHTWGEQEDAWFMVPHGEVLCRA
jgi:hypothetical protein